MHFIIYKGTPRQNEEMHSKSLLQFCLKFISTSAFNVFCALYVTETFCILNDTI